MMRTWTAWRVGLVLIGAAANPVAAQDLRPAVFGAAGVANLYRAEDQSFGTKLNIGAGLGMEWKRLGLDAEVHRTIGLTPRAAQCAISSGPCVGSAHEGFLEATMLSGNVNYFFLGGPRVRPYVTGSVGVDVPLTPALSLRPEFRTYSSVAMSRVNLGLHRGTIGVRYRW